MDKQLYTVTTVGYVQRGVNIEELPVGPGKSGKPSRVRVWRLFFLGMLADVQKLRV